MNLKTGYEIREGSRMLAERIDRAQREAAQRRLAQLRRNLWFAIKDIEDDLKKVA